MPVAQLANAIYEYLNDFTCAGITPETTIDQKLNILYNWPMPTNIPEGIHLEGITTAEQTISLKYQCSNNLCYGVARWFVGTWGGIGYYKRNDRRLRFDNWITRFQQPNIVQYPPFENCNNDDNGGGIASWSKVACIVNPDRFAIYDKRVARSINSISMLMLGNDGLRLSEPIGSRNTLLCLSEIDFIRITNVTPVINGQIHIDELLRPNGNLFLDHGDQQETFLRNRISPPVTDIVDNDLTYNTYLELLENVSTRLFPNDVNRLQKTEMLLFVLADHKGLYIPVIKRLKGWVV